MENKLRTESHKRSDDLESILKLLNSQFVKVEENFIHDFTKPLFPPVFIVGNARSGTTLLYQFLASTKMFSYPTNIMSRFYNSTFIGGLIHKIFVDYDKGSELFGNENFSFDSNLGKTKNANSPHEFWYFWRRFFKFNEIQKLNEQQIKESNVQLFLKELAALENVFNKPVLMKAMILNWNLDILNKLLPNAVFIHISREPLFNMHSLFNARLKFFGNYNEWYSFKPPEYDVLKSQDIYKQLAGQVYFTNKAIEKSAGNYSNYIKISYEEFCDTPYKLLEMICQKDDVFHALHEKYVLKNDIKFDTSNLITNSDFNIVEAEDAFRFVKENDKLY